MSSNEISIGRSKLNDIIIENKVVSGFHAKLVIKGDGTLWVHDLNSTNGVFLNGKRISDKARVMPQDKIKLGTFLFNWQQAILVISSDDENIGVYNEDSSESFISKAKPHRSPNSKLAWGAAVVVLIVVGASLLLTTNIVEQTKKFVSKHSNDWKIKNNPIQYDISCLSQGTESGSLIKTIGDAKKDVLSTQDVTITIEEEEEIGQEVKKEIDGEYEYSDDPFYTDRIQNIYDNLINELPNPRFDYEIHVVESEIINAFTAGGQIFIFTGIVDFVKSDDELACIIGHEIYHNELGHITEKLKELKIARNWLGKGWGDLAYYVSSLLSNSFNQENEVYCDLYGLDLAVSAGYDGCAGIEFWTRMSKNEDESTKNIFNKFSRSHPYSNERVSCNRTHIDNNYYHSCK
jgi:hypothetical protein